MDWAPASAVRWLLDSEHGASDRLIPRWLFLRALGLIYFSAFFSLIFQIRGLIGPEGILPASDYLQAVAHSFGHARFWFAPTLLWLSSGPQMLIVPLLGRHGGIAAARFECLAPRNAGNLFRMFSVIRECRGRFLWLPVRRHAAGSRIHRAFLRSAGFSPGLGCKAATVSRQPVPLAVGVVPHLLRVRHGQDRKRRAAVAAT